MDKLLPSNLVFLIDVSGSMDEPNKLPLVKASMKLLTSSYARLIKWQLLFMPGSGVVLPSTSCDKKQKNYGCIDNLNAGGSTAGGEGIKMAYRIARENS